MSSEQKQAWLFVVFFCIAAVCVAVLSRFFGWVAFGAFGIWGLAGLGPLFFRKKKEPGEVTTDERDRAIAQEATLAGAMLSYGAFMLGCMIPWFIFQFRGKEVITIHVLPCIVFAGMAVFFFARSVTLLVLYGRDKNPEQKRGKEGV